MIDATRVESKMDLISTSDSNSTIRPSHVISADTLSFLIDEKINQFFSRFAPDTYQCRKCRGAFSFAEKPWVPVTKLLRHISIHEREVI